MFNQKASKIEGFQHGYACDLRIHSLFSGTSLIQTTAPERPKKPNDPASPPDDGGHVKIG